MTDRAREDRTALLLLEADHPEIRKPTWRAGRTPDVPPLSGTNGRPSPTPRSPSPRAPSRLQNFGPARRVEGWPRRGAALTIRRGTEPNGPTRRRHEGQRQLVRAGREGAAFHVSHPHIACLNQRRGLVQRWVGRWRIANLHIGTVTRLRREDHRECRSRDGWPRRPGLDGRSEPSRLSRHFTIIDMKGFQRAIPMTSTKRSPYCFTK